ncbi:MAG: PD40 domain-containing protein [Parvularculaceae bacterium]|nr:PD40 domain-containing protein [Parvularculaceae bacterium]
MAAIFLVCARADAQEVFEPGLVSTGYDDAHVSFDPDGTAMYFVRSSPDFAHWTVLKSEKRNGSWGAPAIAPFSGVWSDADVFITRDGLTMFFVSTRPVDGSPRDDTDIWSATRKTPQDEWGAPRHIRELSSPGYEWYPTMTDDGVLYFGSERAGGYGKSDIWRARWIDGRFSEPENLGPVINTPDQEIEPLIARDGRSMIFAARGGPGDKGEYDLYSSFACAGEWTKPAPLPDEFNSPAWDFGPRLSPDGTQFYFTSNRARTHAPYEGVARLEDLHSLLDAPKNGLRDVYVADAARLDLHSPCADAR